MAISYTTVIGVQSVSNPLTKAYAASVSSGDVLVAFVSIYNSSETCSGVSDSVNGSWTQAFGPITAGNGTRMYGFYKLNSASGTPTVTANFSSTNHHELSICAISGLSGGGAFDQQVSNFGLSTNPSIGPTTTLGAAVCAAIAGQTNSGVVPSAYGSGWTLNANLDLGWQKTSFIQQATSSNTALAASWTQSNSYWNAGMMVFKDAGGGGPTTALATTLGNILGAISSVSAPKSTISAALANVSASVASSSVSRTAVAAAIANIAGSVASAGNVTNGVFTSEVLKDYAGNVLANKALNFVRLYNDTTGSLVLSKTGQSTNGSGVVSFSDATLTTGVTYRIDWETVDSFRRMPRKAAT